MLLMSGHAVPGSSSGSSSSGTGCGVGTGSGSGSGSDDDEGLRVERMHSAVLDGTCEGLLRGAAHPFLPTVMSLFICPN